ncbi:MAG: UbiA prenyltransferase family protein [Kiritimatiellae bacterium]|nr:UbiA prenyltransferase family protein [Kiritimatiellia bacterium]
MKLKKHIKTWPQALRLNQWTKNALVMLAWFFAFADPTQAEKARTWTAFGLSAAMAFSFCLLSSAFYLLNDLADIRLDRKHPIKRNRPVASGRIRAVVAIRAALVLFAFAMAFPSWMVFRHPERMLAFGTVLFYTITQCLYSGGLKRIPYLDVAIVAMGFVVRAVAGAAVIDARISPWLLGCTFTLALFLALAKRAHEKRLAEKSRTNLQKYNARALNILMHSASVATVAVYGAYTLSADTIERFHTRKLAISAVFVLLGLLRYLRLAKSSRADTGRPEKVLLTDRILWVVLIGYTLSILVVL